jgi:hypothetical protein
VPKTAPHNRNGTHGPFRKRYRSAPLSAGPGFARTGRNPIWAAPNPDCPTAADCTADPAALTQPVFFISTHGFWDSIIASPATEKAFFLSVTVHAALGIILSSDGKPADHASIQDTADGGNPGGFLGYATAWLEYQLRGNTTAAGAFTGVHPELVTNTNWPGSAVK